MVDVGAEVVRLAPATTPAPTATAMRPVKASEPGTEPSTAIVQGADDGEGDEDVGQNGPARRGHDEVNWSDGLTAEFRRATPR